MNNLASFPTPPCAPAPEKEPSPELPSIVSSPSNAPSQELQKLTAADYANFINELPEESKSLLDEIKAMTKEAQELNKKMNERLHREEKLAQERKEISKRVDKLLQEEKDHDARVDAVARDFRAIIVTAAVVKVASAASENSPRLPQSLPRRTHGRQ